MHGGEPRAGQLGAIEQRLGPHDLVGQRLLQRAAIDQRQESCELLVDARGERAIDRRDRDQPIAQRSARGDDARAGRPPAPRLVVVERGGEVDAGVGEPAADRRERDLDPQVREHVVSDWRRHAASDQRGGQLGVRAIGEGRPGWRDAGDLGEGAAARDDLVDMAERQHQRREAPALGAGRDAEGRHGGASHAVGDPAVSPTRREIDDELQLLEVLGPGLEKQALWAVADAGVAVARGTHRRPQRAHPPQGRRRRGRKHDAPAREHLAAHPPRDADHVSGRRPTGDRRDQRGDRVAVAVGQVLRIAPGVVEEVLEHPHAHRIDDGAAVDRVRVVARHVIERVDDAADVLERAVIDRRRGCRHARRDEPEPDRGHRDEHTAGEHGHDRITPHGARPHDRPAKFA